MRRDKSSSIILCQKLGRGHMVTENYNLDGRFLAWKGRDRSSEIQIRLRKIVTSPDTKGTCFKNSRTSCDVIVSDCFWQIWAEKYHIMWWMRPAEKCAVFIYIKCLWWYLSGFDPNGPPICLPVMSSREKGWRWASHYWTVVYCINTSDQQLM